MHPIDLMHDGLPAHPANFGPKWQKKFGFTRPERRNGLQLDQCMHWRDENVHTIIRAGKKWHDSRKKRGERKRKSKTSLHIFENILKTAYLSNWNRRICSSSHFFAILKSSQILRTLWAGERCSSQVEKDEQIAHLTSRSYNEKRNPCCGQRIPWRKAIWHSRGTCVALWENTLLAMNAHAIKRNETSHHNLSCWMAFLLSSKGRNATALQRYVRNLSAAHGGYGQECLSFNRF